MVKLIKCANYGTYDMIQFMCDTNSDLSTILTDYADELHSGWTAYVSSESIIKKYILKNDLTTWVECPTIDITEVNF